MPRGHYIHDDPKDLVSDCLVGLAAQNPTVKVNTQTKVVYREKTDSEKNRVSIISGGGSGHEPAHAGFVGRGLLDAAVCGAVFASPNVKQIRWAIDRVLNKSGVLVVVMNYSGDALHFGLAASQAKAQHINDSDVRVLLIGDDVSVGKKQGGIVGRRGMAGTVLAYKIAAAAAAEGLSLPEVEKIAQGVAANLGSYGVGLEHCYVPGTNAEPTEIVSGEIDLGMGIHNESGVARKKAPPMSELVDGLLTSITETEDEDRSFVPFAKDGKDEVILLVNNLGGMTELEMGAICGESVAWLRKNGIRPVRVLNGTYMTSLSVPGFSLTLLLLPRDKSSGADKSDILRYLDSPASAPGWGWYSPTEPGTVEGRVEQVEQVRAELPACRANDPEDFLNALKRACEAVVEAEPEITRQDVIAGDGDAGLTLRSGAEGVLKEIEQKRINGKNLISDINLIAEVAEEVMGGTSGSLYSIFFSGLGAALGRIAAGGEEKIEAKHWSEAAESALANLYLFTRARPPSRTLVDPLEAYVKHLTSKSGDINGAAEAALEAANETKKLVALAGRGSYVNQEDLLKADIPDPGAWGVWRLVDAIRGYQAKSQ